ncbi:hypothetical protein K402DRAFT_411547 [Aulographum hederae CBS 113979]|uniref:D-xylulose reductase n=1 Tax=Aulographum hederae CBS 113979 TaxID=1176131 RepID=A0A6G1H5Z9_9PEZI|nr:hypothetical protein K402DRAFT_411547 [Aulographum hederae CBS 113979]
MNSPDAPADAAEAQPLHVFDLPQIYTKPSAETLLHTLAMFTSTPPSWESSDVDEPADAFNGQKHVKRARTRDQPRRIDPEGLTNYLTRIIASDLHWIGDENAKERVWEQASLRMSERSGRTGMAAISRSFQIPTSDGPVDVVLHEPALTADNLGLKTWASSYLLAKRLHSMAIPRDENGKTTILELGSGTGLVGIAAAAVIGTEVLLTDLPEISGNLQSNVVSNEEMVAMRGGYAQTGVLDWSDPGRLIVTQGWPHPKKFPLILATDSLYSPELPGLLVQTISTWLSRAASARVIIECPLREGFSAEIDDFRSQMSKLGLLIDSEGEETGYDDWGSSNSDSPQEVRCWCLQLNFLHLPTLAMADKNPSFVLQKPLEIKYEDRPVPELKSPNDVLVRVQWTGICGSDVHYWQHGRIGSFVLNAPMTLGHESSGTIHSIGSSVTTLQPGDIVAVEPGVPCRRCAPCKAGKYNLCPDMRFAATPPYDGTLCKYYAVPEDFCYKLPQGMSAEEGALVEPLAVGVHVTRQADVKPGDNVVVWGAGPVGLLCCAVAKAFGANEIVSVDMNEERLKFATSFAATQSWRPQKGETAQQSGERLAKDCGFEAAGGADVAIDATGAEPCIQTAIWALRKGGRYVQAGMGKDEIMFPIGAACGKELTIKGSFRYGGGDYKLAVDLVGSGKVDVKRLITGKVGFMEAEKAFEDVKAGKGIKTLIGGPE